MVKIDKSLIRGSLVLLVAFNLFNLINFIFHFGMARLLTISDYGILLTLFSIMYLLAVFSESIQLVIVKYASREDDKGKLKNLLRRALKKSFFVSLFLFVTYLVVAVPLSYLLKIEYPLVALTGFMILLLFALPVTRGLLQGKKRFRSLGVNMLIEGVIKLGMALVLVYIGWRVYGAIAGTILGLMIAFFLSFSGFRDITKSKEKKANVKNIYEYSRPAFGINLAILLFYSLDVILARIFFSEVVAGSYAIASILAKTIFIATQPISRAMFPLSAENKTKKKSENVFLNSFVITMLAVVAALVLFYFFPGIIVKIFSGKSITESIGLLFYLGIAISLLSLANLVLLYKLSLGKVRGYMYLFLLIAVEVFLLAFFSKDLLQFSIAFVTAAAIFLWGVIFLVGE
ncbi:MAG: oligosaccharide flippase family protein [Nanoarchaeota archaeon]|nr:oligosaccharide flippase family protein [Nanoarchaeota archaeon]MBU1051207.1 oligosaccharide flippase family protein [Nanoarchaeota archaeon]MBU1988146.1 oligosaccharide flippase family protein [Nanoarchaeota archaeon]